MLKIESYFEPQFFNACTYDKVTATRITAQKKQKMVARHNRVKRK
jgi:hypothetical protein